MGDRSSENRHTARHLSLAMSTVNHTAGHLGVPWLT